MAYVRDREVRMSLVGPLGVGKSSLVMQYLQGVFGMEIDPTIEDSYRKQISLPDFQGQVSSKSPLCLLDILDTAGQEEYSAMRDRYMRTSEGFLCVYSITSQSSFDEVEPFIEQILRVKDWDDGVGPIILVANKSDLESERKVSVSAGRDLAAKYKCCYVETSAKTAANVENLFIDLTKMIIAYNNENYVNRQARRAKGKRGLFSKKSQPQQQLQALDEEFSLKVPNTRLYGDDNKSKSPPTIVVPESTYAADMKRLRNEIEFEDVFFKTTDSPELIPAHKFIVVARCNKMKQLIEAHDKSTNQQFGIEVPFKASTFSLFLEFAYSNSVTLTSAESEIPELLHMANAWDMPDLIHLLATQYPELVPESARNVEVDPLHHSVPKYKRDLRRSLIASTSDYKSFDVKFIVKDEPGKTILAHKAILAQRSPYFRAMFTGGTKEKTAYEIEMTDFPHLPLLTAIEYCYTDDVRYMDDVIAVDLLIVANKLCLGRLKLKVAEYIASGMHWDNIVKMYRLAVVADCDALREYCTFYLCRVYGKLTKHTDFGMLTTEEKDFLRDSRLNWPDIENMEIYWHKKLTEKDEDTKDVKESKDANGAKEGKDAKGCAVM